ncbi:hypothetical protein PVK06_031783 [Gossypium arboreum]|uniref:MULE transposase domain-containing protein n=1 Tax=Gossypium arboreum TaxID=29729 RepID=A0ABR0NRY8_GOSAR|nr:hypothetical protein PVK06_031783 [Gossypium arboreum]
MIISTEANIREMTNNGEDYDQDVKDFSDFDVDEVPNNIDDEGPEEVEDVHSPSFSNLSREIILQNEHRGNMLNIDPEAVHAPKFPEYADIVPAHRLVSNSQFKELFVGQQFKSKADCVFAIKQYSMKLSIDYKGWISAMVEYISGTVVDLQTLPYRGPNGQLELGRRVFRRLFWTFDPCVTAFSHCKPLVQVDGTWLYENYKQILLIAVAQDGNGNVLLIAFAIVESKNSESWAYFICNLRRHVVRQDNIYIISNRSKGLVATIWQSEVPWRCGSPYTTAQPMRILSSPSGQTFGSMRRPQVPPIVSMA